MCEVLVLGLGAGFWGFEGWETKTLNYGIERLTRGHIVTDVENFEL